MRTYKLRTNAEVFFCVNEKGQKNGLYVSFYSNGQLEIKCTYINGKKDGPYEEYFEDGRLLEKCVYQNDKPMYGEKAKEYRNNWEKTHHFEQMQQEFYHLLSKRKKTVSIGSVLKKASRYLADIFRKERARIR